MSLNGLLSLLPDNATKEISADDLRIVTTGLWQRDEAYLYADSLAADGVTDDSAALTALLATASGAGQGVQLPKGTILLSSRVTVPDNLHIRGISLLGTKIIGDGFSVGNYSTVSDMTLDGTGSPNGYGVSVLNSTTFSYSKVERCYFTSWASAGFRSQVTADNKEDEHWTVQDCLFQDNTYAIFCTGANYATVRNNIIISDPGQRGIFFYSGRANIITGNKVVGGIVGIGALFDRNVVNKRTFKDNIIANNQVLSASEEGISLDMYGNTAAQVSVLDWGTVATSSYDAPSNNLTLTLDALFDSVPDNQFQGYPLYFADGDAVGMVFTIASHTGNSFVINNVYEGISTYPQAGDTVVIGLVASGNIITGNVVRNAGTYGIGLWGCNAGNIISQNVTESTQTVKELANATTCGIEVWGLDGMVQSTLNYTGRLGRAPSPGNIVKDNVLVRTNTKNKVNVYGGGGFTPYGNQFIGNSYSNGRHETDNIADQPALPLANTTANRPTQVSAGFEYFDTTLGKSVWWDGTGWVDATGATA